MLIELDDIKRHLRIADLAADSELDPYLADLLDAAVDYAGNYLGRAIPWQDPGAPSEDIFPPSVRQAILILIAEFHENREQTVIGTSAAELPAVCRLLHFYRVGLGI